MNKAKLIEIVAEKAEITKKDSGYIVNLILDEITASLQAGESVKISGFGNFLVKSREARVARNPMTKEEIQVPASKKVSFKASDVLKASLEE
jgi:DNA-binding protein HU-beta